MKLLSYQDLQARGIVRNRVTLGRWIKSYGFPKAIPLGPNTVAWSEVEVDAWLAARAASRQEAA